MTSPEGYSRAQIRLHWAVAVLLVPQYLLHDGVAGAFETGLETGTLTLTLPAIGHMALGLVILLLAFWRLALRQEHGVPRPPAREPGWARLAARATHAAFYVVLILLPVTGGLAWGTASEAMGGLHEALRAVLLGLIVLHVAAVFVHQLVWKTELLHRMRRGVD